MKNEQVVPNYMIMLETSITLLALVGSGWLLIKLISACFWLPGFLKKWQIEEAMNEIKQCDDYQQVGEDEKTEQCDDSEKSKNTKDSEDICEPQVNDKENKKDI